MATVSGNITSGYTISGISEKGAIYATDYVSDSSTYVEIFGLDGDDNLSDFIAGSRLTFIYGGYGADMFFISGQPNGVRFWQDQTVQLRLSTLMLTEPRLLPMSQTQHK